MRAFSGFLLLLLVPFTQAATLQGSNGVEILAIDGQKVNSSFLTEKEASVDNGKHQIVVKYSKNFKKGNTITSKPHVLNLDINSDTKIAIKSIYSAEQAKREVKRGLVWLVSDSKQTLEIANSDTLSGKGLFPYRDIENLIATYNIKNGIATHLAVPMSNSEGQASKFIAPSTNNKVLPKAQQLMLLYSEATIAERKRFRMWLLEQDMK